MDEITISETIKHMEGQINENQTTPDNKSFYDLLPKFDSLDEIDFIIIGKLLQINEKKTTFHENISLSYLMNEIFASPGQLEYSLVLGRLTRLVNMSFSFKENSDGLTELISLEEFMEMFLDFSVTKSPAKYSGVLIGDIGCILLEDDALLFLNLNTKVIDHMLELS